MQRKSFLRHARGFVRTPVDWIHVRASLTPQERHNLRVNSTPLAVLARRL